MNDFDFGWFFNGMMLGIVLMGLLALWVIERDKRNR